MVSATARATFPAQANMPNRPRGPETQNWHVSPLDSQLRLVEQVWMDLYWKATIGQLLIAVITGRSTDDDKRRSTYSWAGLIMSTPATPTVVETNKHSCRRSTLYYFKLEICTQCIFIELGKGLFMPCCTSIDLQQAYKTIQYHARPCNTPLLDCVCYLPFIKFASKMQKLWWWSSRGRVWVHWSCLHQTNYFFTVLMQCTNPMMYCHDI